jgi:acyl dehydratase
MARNDRLLTLSDVKAGDELPSLTYEVTTTTIVLGALASRDWRPMHHDKDFAVHRNGTRDIFMNTPNQAAWFERYLTDWTGPRGRLGKIRFRMKDSVFPGDNMVFRGRVASVETDASGCAWANLDLTLAVGDKPVTDCNARIAIPVDDDDNPWQRSGDRWAP